MDGLIRAGRVAKTLCMNEIANLHKFRQPLRSFFHRRAGRAVKKGRLSRLPSDDFIHLRWRRTNGPLQSSFRHCVPSSLNGPTNFNENFLFDNHSRIVYSREYNDATVSSSREVCPLSTFLWNKLNGIYFTLA